MKRGWPIQVAWWVVCCVTILVMRESRFERPKPEMSQDEAEVIALRELRQVDPERYSNYEIVSSARSSKGELGTAERWVVLCDSDERSGLDEAVVLEVDVQSGAVLRIRKGLESRLGPRRTAGG